jgi:hypothetical protein
MTAFTKDELKTVREILDRHLAAAAKEAGLESAQLGRGSFNGGACTFKLEIVKAGAQSKEAADFVQHAKFGMLGDLKPEHLGATFTANGESFTVKGMNRKARKRPIICERADGKLFVFDEAAVARRIAA